MGAIGAPRYIDAGVHAVESLDNSVAPINLTPSGGGLFASTDSGTQQRVANALAGTVKTPWQQQVTDQNGRVITRSSGVSQTARTTGQDVLAQTLADQQAQMQAQQQSIQQQAQARQDYQAGLNQTVAGARSRADQAPGQYEQAAQGLLGQTAVDTERIRQAGQQNKQDVTADIDSARQEFLSRQQSTVGQFKDTSALQAQQTSRSFAADVEDEKSQIIQKAQQMGLDPSDPVVQGQLQNATMKGISRAGQAAAQAGIEYNNTLATLNQSYDNLSAQMRSAQTNQLGAAGQNVIQSEESAAALNASAYQMSASFKAAGLQASQQMNALADQYQLNGNQMVAEWLRGQDVAYSSYAPLVAMAASLDASNTNTSIPAVGINGSNAGNPYAGLGTSGKLSGGGQITSGGVGKIEGKQPVQNLAGTKSLWDTSGKSSSGDWLT